MAATKIFVFVVFLISTQIHGEKGETINITFIENAVAKGAVCLDGSPGAYLFDKGIGEGVNNLIVYLPGGGWCESRETCLVRSKTTYGSSNNVTPPFFGAVLSPNQTINPDFYNWNKLYILYCDGASFMADVAAGEPETSLYLRGARIFRAAIEEVLAKEMITTTNAILMGNSAGGLATMLNCDRFRAFLPNACNVKCVADSGFFIDAKNLPGAEIRREKYYTEVITFHELANALPTSCTSRINSSSCFFPENFIGDIQTPLFVLNSAFDQFQISNKLDPPPGNYSTWFSCLHNISTCNANELLYFKEFRCTFLNILNDVADNPSRGMFISSCYIHDFLYKNNKWSQSPTLENKTIAEAIGDWFFDRNHVSLIDETDTPIDCENRKSKKRNMKKKGQVILVLVMTLIIHVSSYYDGPDPFRLCFSYCYHDCDSHEETFISNLPDCVSVCIEKCSGLLAPGSGGDTIV